MKFLHVALSFLLLLASLPGWAAELDVLDSGQAGTAHVTDAGHGCCEESNAPAGNDCCDGPTCGQCSNGFLALIIPPAVRSASPAAAPSERIDSRLDSRTAAPPFRPPIA